MILSGYPHCDKCNKDVDLVTFEYEMVINDTVNGPVTMNTGWVTVIVRCHGEVWSNSYFQSSKEEPIPAKKSIGEPEILPPDNYDDYWDDLPPETLDDDYYE